MGDPFNLEIGSSERNSGHESRFFTSKGLQTLVSRPAVFSAKPLQDMSLRLYPTATPGMSWRNLAQRSRLLYAGGTYCSPPLRREQVLEAKVENGEKHEHGENALGLSIHSLRGSSSLSVADNLLH